ncbi:hypothetical protein ACFWY5_29885 [Nonomuraea sp. NPDC059007]|uniref:hypothetical protein n=1 Tax=Nonomuraea sp. NPDC059007 TaxID=3346692 RepID=UPI0036B5A9C0
MANELRVEADWGKVNELVAQSDSYFQETERVVESIADLTRRWASQYSDSGEYAESFTAVMSLNRLLQPVGYVYADKHEMVNEFGWTDVKGVHHQGRFVFQRALRAHRIK